MGKFNESYEQFLNNDLDKFGGCLRHLQAGQVYVEWRIQKGSGTPCIIQFYENGDGYVIFKQQ